ncbi:hypothetical protein J1N35_040093, partial [Gossypium stocksii]
KSNGNAMLFQAKTKKEYKKIMVEMLSSMDFESEDEDEKSLMSLIKIIDFADHTTFVIITKTRINK